MLKKRPAFLAALALAAMLFVPSMTANADLTLSPLRVVFKGRDRSAVVSLINLTNHVNTYRVNWQYYKMDENAKYTPDHEAEKSPYSVGKMVIFSPRQVIINPNEHQLVRLSLRRPANLPPGEYRGHLTFTRLQPEKRTKDLAPDEEKEKKKGQTVSLNVNLSFSIPVIVRNGSDSDVKVQLTNPKFELAKGSRPTLNLELNRVSGTLSTYGTIRVYWQKPGQPEKQIGMQNNVALYPELKRRLLSIKITEPRVAGGTVRVVYKGKYESEGTTWDEKVFPVGG